MAVKNVSDGRFTRNAPALEEMHILWITAGLSCDGESVALAAKFD